MMQIWTIDSNCFLIGTCEKHQDELTSFDIDKQPIDENGFGFYKAKWNPYNMVWVEGATQEEIKAWEEANKPQPQEPSKTDILCQKVEVLEEENTKQNTDITANTDMIFVALDATTELNESNITNTEMVLISMDALTEINEQIIALQEQINILKGVK